MDNITIFSVQYEKYILMLPPYFNYFGRLTDNLSTRLPSSRLVKGSKSTNRKSSRAPCVWDTFVSLVRREPSHPGAAPHP
jgi:hypothetical protein